MIPVDLIEVVSLADAKPGEFLFRIIGAGRAGMVFKANAGPKISILSFYKDGEKWKTSFGQVDGAGSVYFFRYKGARLAVDRESFVHGTKTSPLPGTVLLTEGGAGILYESPRGLEAVVRLDGEIVSPDWGRDPGFFKWAVELPLGGGSPPLQLIEVSTPPAN